nr:metallophosphoesterase [uncultured Acetatifactor sp.]
MTDILFTIIAAAALALLWVMLYDTNRFVIRKHTLTDPRIRRGCRAVLLTDLHNKCYGKGNERLLAAIRGQKPDFILIAGDLVTANTKAPLEPAVQLLENLVREYPVYYANGNHEQRLRLSSRHYGKMAKQYRKALKRIGVEPMLNSHVDLPEYGLAVYGAEIDMEYYRRFRTVQMPPDYLPRILGQAPADAYTVLLAHNPDYFPQYAAWGADLTLSGHVHGGVARVPLWGKGVLSPAWHFFPKYDGGIFGEGASGMGRGRGLGSHTIPVRAFNPGELWVLDFRPGETDVLS